MSNKGPSSLYQRINKIIQHLLTGLYERDHALRISLLAALSGQSVFFLGPPGTAKSLVARRLSLAFVEARFFEYLMGRFSTPDELFGPVSIARLKHEDRYSRNIKGYLPDAHIVFLDEIWKASPPIQNSLLTALNERTYQNGDETIRLPLKCFIAASNEIHLADETRAFWDRFLLRIQVDPIDDTDDFLRLITEEGVPSLAPAPNPVQDDEWNRWLSEISSLSLSRDLLGLISHLRDDLLSLAAEDPGFYISDRRWKMISLILRASAYFHDRTEASLIDGFLISHCIWNSGEQRAELQKRFASALKKSAFVQSDDPDEPEEIVRRFQDDLSEQAAETVEVERLVPLRYDGEYALFIPETSDPVLSYRVWFDDLENLDERGELELFVHEGGNFTHTEIHRMAWSNSERWELEGDLGAGKIESAVQREQQRQPRNLGSAEVRELNTRATDVMALLENRIRDIRENSSALVRQAADHLFVPGSDTGVLEEAARSRIAILEHLMADMIDSAGRYGLELS